MAWMEEPVNVDDLMRGDSTENAVAVIKNYLIMDNAGATLRANLKRMRTSMVESKSVIVKYMADNGIDRIPTKQDGSEYLELREKAKAKKPTREEMTANLQTMIQDGAILDKSAVQIMECIFKPVRSEHVYELYRKHRKVTSDSVDIFKIPEIKSVRELLTSRKQLVPSDESLPETVPNKQQRKT